MFLKADLVLITKIDLLPYLPQIRVEVMADARAHVMPRPRYLCVSATSGEGMEQWLTWLEQVRVPQPRSEVAPQP